MASSCSRISAEARIKANEHLDLMNDHRLVGEVDDRLGDRQSEWPEPCAVASHQDQSLHDDAVARNAGRRTSSVACVPSIAFQHGDFESIYVVEISIDVDLLPGTMRT